jgi:hypothetical protein
MARVSPFGGFGNWLVPVMIGAPGYVIRMCAALVQKLCCQDPPGRGLVVCHLAVQGYEPCNTLDEVLEQAAATYRWGHPFESCTTVSDCSNQIGWPLPLMAVLGRS